MCIVYDPNKVTEKLQGTSSSSSSLQEKQRVLIIDENDMNANNVERLLGAWAVEFNKRVAEKYCTKSPRFTEMRCDELRNYY